MRTPITRLVALAGTGVLVTFLTACAPPGIAERSYDGFPEGTTSPPAAPATGAVDLPGPDLDPRVQWTDRSGVIALSLWGSSSCPTEPTAIEAVAQDQLTIATRRSDGFLGACTADLAVRTYELRVPGSVSIARPLIVVVADHTLVLPAQ